MTDKRKSARIAIVILNFNGLDDTRVCLKSLELSLSESVFVLVVDNASEVDPTEVLSQEFPWCEVIRSPVNEGWAGGNNLGIQRSLELECDFTILLNNDTKVAENFIERMSEAGVENPDFGVIGPVINHMESPEVVQTDGCVFNRMTRKEFFARKEVALQSAQTPILVDVDIVNGCCMMLSRNLVEKIGLIDERFFLIHEESDYCLRALQAGYRCGVFGESLVWHKQSVSFYRAGKKLQCYYDVRNLQLLLRKHLNNHSGSDSFFSSWLRYFKSTYYRYCLEVEHDQPDSARAVIEGFWDGFVHRFGPMKEKRRYLVGCIQGVFEVARWLKSSPKSSPSQS